MSEESQAPKVIDAHIHCVDFSQKQPAGKDFEDAITNSGVDKAVLMGLPVIKKWSGTEKFEPERAQDDSAPCYYYSYTDQIVADLYTEMPSDLQNRIAPLICGFNPTDKRAVDYIKALREKNDFFVGVGEILLRHDHLTNLINDEPAYVTHPALVPIYEYCSDNNLPMLLHQNSNSQADNNVFEYLHEIEEVLEGYPKLQFIWAHGGMSPRSKHPEYAAVMKRLLETYQNLYIDISWTLSDEIIATPETWVPLVEKWADRMMIGSDIVGNFQDLKTKLATCTQFFEHISPEVQKQIGYETANTLYFS